MSWPTVALGEVFDIARGGSPRPIAKYITTESDGLNWIKIGDASVGGKYIRQTKEKIRPEGLSKTRSVRPGDFLLTNSMSFGRPYIVDTHGCIHDGWLVLKPQPDFPVNADYFYHLLSSESIYRRFASRAGGSTVRNLNIDIVAGIDVPLPPLAEQRRIAAILDKADELRRKRQRALHVLNGLTQSIFLEMFGSPLETKTDVLGDIAEFKSGATPPRGASVYWDGAIPWISPKDMKRPYLSDSQDHVSEEAFVETNLKRIDPNSVLIVVRGMILAHTVPIALTTRDVAINQDVKAIRFEEAIDPMFGLWSLKALERYILSKVSSAAHGTKRLPMEELESLPVLVAPKSLQRQFASLVTKVEKMAGWAEHSLTAMNRTFGSLQFRAFNGEL